MEGCPFCAIVAKETPAEVIYETPHTLAIFPLEPATRGHTMIITKSHVPNFLELHSDKVPELGTVVLRVGRALREVLKPQGMNLISSAGEVATQTVMHLHIHLVPRWDNDGFGDLWPPKYPTSAKLLDEVADQIREYCQTENLEHRNPE